jgi:plasmid stabilization system protein ParE
VKPLLFNPVAAADLDEIFEYIKAADEGAAKRVAAAILESAELLRKFPNLGTLSNHRPLRFRNIRFIPVRGYRNYLIFY